MAENVEIRDLIFNLQVRTEDGKVKIEGLTKGFVKAETAFKKMKGALDETNESIKGAGVSTGLANTAVLEFGRTISDAPYGIQGMGNNLTQLTTILGQMAGDVKEGETVLGNLRKAFIGPLGVVVAVQIVIATFEILRKRMSETTDILTKLDVAVGTSAVNLKLAKTALDNENTSLEEKQEIVNALNEQYPEWNLQLEESGNLSAGNVEKIDKEIAALGRLAKAKAYQKLLEEAYAKRVEMSAEFAREQGTTLSRLKNVFAGFGNEVAGQTIRFKAFQDGLKDVNEDIEFLEKGVQKEGLVDLLLGSDAKGKPTKDTRKKVKEFVVDTYGIAAEEAVKAREKQQKMMKKLGIDIPSLLMGGEEGKEAFREGLAALYQEVEDVPIDYSGVGTSFNEILETMAPAFAEIGNFFAAEADRAIAIEENKTNKINDQLKRRLANEQLSAEERDKINQQIAKNEAKLVEKENEINKKRFEQEKAFSIVQATVNTYLAASDVLAREKMGAVGKAIAVAAVITSGLAQVAAISRQQFTAKAMPSPNLSAQGGTSGAGSPNFNVVGASQQTQIAEAIAGVESRPVKAYVVSSDVSTAQELDRRIVEGASI